MTSSAENRVVLLDERIQTCQTTSSTIVVPVSNDGSLTVRDVILKDGKGGALVRFLMGVCTEVNSVKTNIPSYFRALSQPKNRRLPYIPPKPDPTSGVFCIPVGSKKFCRLLLELVPHPRSPDVGEAKLENLSGIVELRFWFIIDAEVVNHFHATIRQYLSWVKTDRLLSGSGGPGAPVNTLDGHVRFTNMHSIIALMTQAAGSNNVPSDCENIFRAGNPWAVVSNTSTRCMSLNDPRYSDPVAYSLTQTRGPVTDVAGGGGTTTRVTFIPGSCVYEIPTRLLPPDNLMRFSPVFGIDVDVDGWNLMQYLRILASRHRPELCAKIDAATLQEVVEAYLRFTVKRGNPCSPGTLHLGLEPGMVFSPDKDTTVYDMVPEKELALIVRRPGAVSKAPPDAGKLGQGGMLSLLTAAAGHSDDDSDDDSSDSSSDDEDEETSIVPHAGAGRAPTTVTELTLYGAGKQQKLTAEDIEAIVGHHIASREHMASMIRQWGQSVSAPSRDSLIALDDMLEIRSSIIAKREAMERNAVLLTDNLAKALAALAKAFPDASDPDVVAKRRELRAEYREATQRQVNRLETVAMKMATAWFFNAGGQESVTNAARSLLSSIRETHRRQWLLSTETPLGDEYNLFRDTAPWFGEFMHKFADAGDDIMSRFNPVIFLVLESCNALSGHPIVYLLLLANISNAAYAEFSVMAFNSILTGIPGLGKSWVLNLFRNFLNIGARFVDSLTPKALQSWGNIGAGMLVHDDVSPAMLGIFPAKPGKGGKGGGVSGERESVVKTLLTERRVVTETTYMMDGDRGVKRHESINFMGFNMGSNATEAEISSDAIQSRIAIMAWRPDKRPRVDGRAMGPVENDRPAATAETKALQTLNALAILMGRLNHFTITAKPTTIAFDVVVDAFMGTIDRLRLPLFQGRGGRGGRVRILQRMKRIAFGSATLRALMMSTMIKDTGMVSNTPFEMSHMLNAAKLMVVTERDAIQAFIGSGRYIISDSIVTLLVILLDLMKPAYGGAGKPPTRPGGADGYMAINLQSGHALTDFVMISMPPSRTRSSWKTYLANTSMAARLGVTEETLGPALYALFDMEIPARSMTDEMKMAWDSVTPDIMKPTTSVADRATISLVANGFEGPRPVDASKGSSGTAMPPPTSSFMDSILQGRTTTPSGTGGGGRAYGGSASDPDGAGAGAGAGGRAARLMFGDIPDTELENIKTNKRQNTKAAWVRDHVDSRQRKTPFLYIRREVFALANLARVLQMVVTHTPIATRVPGKITVPVSVPGSPALPCTFEIPPPPPGCKQFYTLRNPVPVALGETKAPDRKLFSKDPLLDALRGHASKRKIVFEKMSVDALAYRCRALQMGYGPSAPYIETAWKTYTPAEMATLEQDTCKYLDALRADGKAGDHPATPVSYPIGFIPVASRREAAAVAEAEMPGCLGSDWRSHLASDRARFKTAASLTHIMTSGGDIGEDTDEERIYDDDDDDDDDSDDDDGYRTYGGYGGGVGTTPFVDTPTAFGFQDVTQTPASTPVSTPIATPTTPTATRLQDVMFNPGVSTLPASSSPASKKRQRDAEDSGPGFKPGFTKRVFTEGALAASSLLLMEEEEE